MGVEKSAGHYSDIYKASEEYKKPYTESIYFGMWQKVIALIPDKMPIVELGCGVGQFAQMCKDLRKPYLYGCDFSEEAIKMCLAKGLPCSISDITKDDLKLDGCFIALEVFEHINNDFKVIENIGSGKDIILSLPDFDYPSHVRYFKDKFQIILHYDGKIRFSHIEKHEHWFICKGKTK